MILTNALNSTLLTLAIIPASEVQKDILNGLI